jgi:hypothetical protein
MVEGIHESQALIKISLRLVGTRRDGVMKSTEIVKEGYLRKGAFSGCALMMTRQQTEPQHRTGQDATDTH